MDFKKFFLDNKYSPKEAQKFWDDAIREPAFAHPGTPTASTNAIFTHAEHVQLEQSENQIVREGEAHCVSGLLLHHVTEETKVWMLHFQRELSVLRFTTCQEKGCVPLLWEVRCRKDCARSVPRRVCLPFVA